MPAIKMTDVKVEQTGPDPDGIPGFCVTFNNDANLSVSMNSYSLQTLMEVVKTMGAGIKFAELNVKF